MMKNSAIIFLMLLVSGLSMVVTQDKFMNMSIVRVLAAHKHLHITYNKVLNNYEYDNASFLQVLTDFVKAYQTQNIVISDYSLFFLDHLQKIQKFQKQLALIQSPLTMERQIQLASKLLQQLSIFHKNVYHFDSVDPGRFVGLLDSHFLSTELSTDQELLKYRKVLGFPKIVALPYTFQYFHSYTRKETSKYDQDGVIEAIFQLIRTRNKFFVEVGGGRHTDNSNYLRTNKGWNGIMFQDGHFYDVPKTDPMLRIAKITSTNVIQTFNTQKVPKQLDFLSVDIDGNDYWVTKEILKQYKPAVLSVAFNSNFPYNVSATVKNCHNSFQWNYDKYYGASISAIFDMVTSHGYSYVYHFYFTDIFFVRTDLLPEPYRGMTIKSTFHTFPRRLMNTNLRKFQLNDLTKQDIRQCLYYQDYLKNRKGQDLKVIPPPIPSKKNQFDFNPYLQAVIFGALIIGFLYGFSRFIKKSVQKEFRSKTGNYNKESYTQINQVS